MKKKNIDDLFLSMAEIRITTNHWGEILSLNPSLPNTRPRDIYVMNVTPAAEAAFQNHQERRVFRTQYVNIYGTSAEDGSNLEHLLK